MGQSVCPAAYEAVIEREEAGEVGCPICGRPAEAHSPEVDLPVGSDEDA